MWPKTAKKKPDKTSNSSSESHAPVDVSLDKKADSSVPPVSVSLDKRVNLRSECITQLDKWHDLYEK